MSVLFTFPGQGSQRAGMLNRLAALPEARPAIQAASQALGEDVLVWDTSDALRSTVAAQICLLAAGVAMAAVLAARDAQPDMVAGLSIGAYPAAVVADVLDYEDAVRLVHLRATLMQRRFPSGYGMTAISGLPADALQALIDAVHGPHEPVYLANFNAPAQLVISGSDAALAKVAALALGKGAARATRIDIAVPSHCPLLDEDALVLQQAFDAVAVRNPQLEYLSASRARVLRDGREIAHDLAFNMARPVLWHDTVRLAWERGARLAVEMPSGSVLSGLTAPVFAGGRVACSDNHGPDSLAALVRRTRQL